MQDIHEEMIHVNVNEVLTMLAVLATMLVVLLAISAKTRPIPGESSKDGREKVRRLEELRTVVFLFGLVTMVALVAVYAGAAGSAWGFALALLPFIMIVQHAMYLRNVRQPVLVPREAPPNGSPNAEPTSSGPIPAGPTSSHDDWWLSVLRSAKRTTERYFSASSLAIRYGASAVAVLMVGLVAFLFIFVPELPGASGTTILEEQKLVHPAMLGAAGAYVYVLLHLGHRNLTHDVTSGGAMWCSISLAIGPILACAISYFLIGTSQDPSLGADAIYFMAGLSPRYVTSRVEALVRKAWGAPSEIVPPPRTIPTTQVKGITAEIAERLAEEGIADVHGLAMADPLRLIRNTNFDRRQIVAWIDEAILITTLPGRWETLEDEGIPGAVALVSLVYDPPHTQQSDDNQARHPDEKTFKEVR